MSDTSFGMVVTLAKMPASGSGPGLVPACQPTTAAPDLAAASNATFCSLVSKPPATMPSGFSVSAWFIAAVRPQTEPWPSMTVTVQPIALAASFTPFGGAENAAVLQVRRRRRRSSCPSRRSGRSSGRPICRRAPSRPWPPWSPCRRSRRRAPDEPERQARTRPPAVQLSGPFMLFLPWTRSPRILRARRRLRRCRRRARRSARACVARSRRCRWRRAASRR